jgi:drug/metabolite transporter (DMT)-like permease
VIRTPAERSTLLAFGAIVLFGGANAVGVRASDQELAPLWGAALRFAIAAALLLAVVAVMRLRLPSGTALLGSIVYGVLAFAGAFGFVYTGLVHVPAGVGQVTLALVPLLTLLFSVAVGQERFRWQGLLGTLIAIAGIGIVFADRASGAIPAASLLAVVAGAACMAGSNVVAKRFPGCHPLVNNAIAMSAGAILLLAASIVAGEDLQLPTRTSTWIAVAYLSVVGSIVVFSLFLYVIRRWSASASSYVMLLMPLVTVALAWVIAREAVSGAYFVGAALVLGGVYVGAFGPSLESLGRLVGAAGARGAAATATPTASAIVPDSAPAQLPSATTPGCA